MTAIATHLEVAQAQSDSLDADTYLKFWNDFPRIITQDKRYMTGQKCSFFCESAVSYMSML